MRHLLWLAGLGFLLSTSAHVVSLAGAPPHDYDRGVVLALFLGVFVVFVPAVVMHPDAERTSSGAYVSWRDAFRGCPAWLKLGIGAVFTYLMLFAMSHGLVGKTIGISEPLTPVLVQAWSGICALFYACAYGMIGSRIARREAAGIPW